MFGLAFLLAGCRFLSVLQPTVEVPPVEAAGDGTPHKYSYRLPPYVFLADFEINRHLPVFQDLARLRDQVYQELRLSGSNQVVLVYLFADEPTYEQYMRRKNPDLPKRRAFFVAQPRALGDEEDLMVYTYWSDRIQQDLRHELTHALLHSVLQDVPLWLDEGLAEYFETPASAKGLNQDHLGHIVQAENGAFRPDMARLEGLRDVQQMTPPEYRESWAWTHWMLRGDPQAKTVLLTYLHELRTNPRPGPLLPRLQAVVPDPDRALLRHLETLRTKLPATPTALR